MLAENSPAASQPGNTTHSANSVLLEASVFVCVCDFREQDGEPLLVKGFQTLCKQIPFEFQMLRRIKRPEGCRGVELDRTLGRHQQDFFLRCCGP